jgi:hypothetical protein
MNRLNSEGHDESQYLPLGTPPVNAFRAQHGTVKWEGTSCKAISWMPDKLYDLKIIDKHHLDTASSFLTAKIHTQKVLGIADIRGILHDKPDALSAPRGDVFFALLKQLCKPELNMLLWVTCDDRNHGNIPLACQLIGTIKHALENAQKIIDNLYGICETTKSPAPEMRPEFKNI